jgi:guanylate kinase
LTLSISSTTRPPRGRERHGVEYFFLNKQEFEKEIQAGRFAEWALVHGNYYGTSKEVIESAFAQGKSVLLDIDVQGAASLAQSFPEATFRIFVAPPDMATLETRLRARGTDSEETIQKRLRNAEKEMERSPEFDKVVINDQLDRAYGELREIVRKRLT